MRSPAPSLASLALLVASPFSAWAQADLNDFDERELTNKRPPPAISSDLMQTGGLSRFHFITRGRIEDGGSVWSLEPKGFVRVGDGVAVGAVIPLGIVAPTGPDNIVLGNLRFSVAGGFSVPLDPRNGGLLDPRLHIGLGLDVYAPTQTDPNGTCNDRGLCPNFAALRRLRAFEPELYLPNVFLSRARIHAAFSVAGFRAAFETAFSPGIYIRGPLEEEGLLLYDMGARLSYDVVQRVPIFVELVTHGTIAHPTSAPLTTVLLFNPNEQPVHLSLGARPFFDEIAPSLFITYDLTDQRVFFGFDITGVMRPKARRVRPLETIDG